MKVIDDRRDDGKIADSVEEIIKERMFKSAHDIKIQSRDGFITLMGFVDTLSEKNTAGELAETIEGVKSVENCLTVSTDGNFSDKEAETELLNKLSGIQEIEGISAQVKRGVAILEGRVNTLRKRNLAIHEASKAHGIKDVVSHIEITSIGGVDDASIHNDIQLGFKESQLQDCDISSDVNNGSVTLSGYVNNTHDIETAMEIAEGVEGVRNIKNSLKFREEKGI